MKILVADDDFVSRNVLSQAVESLGHECQVCEDGTQAWEQFQEHPFEVVISDWMMPGLDGLQLCEKIRELPATDYCYFILLSSRDKRHDILKGLEAGADDYLTKPLDLDELKARLISASRVTSLHKNLVNAQAVAVQNSKLAAVGQLAAGVAHELNSPLGAMKLTLESAKRKTEEPAVKRKIDIALRALLSMQEVVRQLMETSHHRENKSGSTDVNSLVKHTMGLLRSHPQADGVELETRLEDTAEVAIPAAELQLVMSILVSNALDAVSAEGARKKAVSVGGDRESDSVFLVEVIDHGFGIPENVRKRVFEPFFTTKPVGQGVGLGLSMARNLIQQRGGELSLKPDLPTTFQLRLPIVNLPN